MLWQAFLYWSFVFYDWLLNMDIPQSWWDAAGKGYNAVSTISAWVPAVPYVPYGDMADAVVFSITVFGTLLAVSAVIGMLNALKRIR